MSTLVNESTITIGDYAFAGTWENPLDGAPSITARICTITKEAQPRRLGDKGDIHIAMTPEAPIDPNGQEVSDGQGGTVIVSGMPVLTQAQFYLYFRKLIIDALEEPIVVEG